MKDLNLRMREVWKIGNLEVLEEFFARKMVKAGKLYLVKWFGLKYTIKVNIKKYCRANQVLKLYHLIYFH